MAELAASCQSDCEMLLKIIKSCIVKGERHRRWKSIKMAIRAAMSKKQVEDLQERIHFAQITTSLYSLALLKYEVQNVRVSLGDLKDRAESFETDQVDEIASLRIPLQRMHIEHPAHERPWPTVDSDSESTELHDKLQNISTIIDTFSRAFTAREHITEQHAILNSLRYKSRPIRHAAEPFLDLTRRRLAVSFRNALPAHLDITPLLLASVSPI
ncbi:hypothetical protein B0H63DRAFT_480751 [Podospora didyma]|uniref:Uncharacterized protein n=1 Tax=Podospora didyma TaxID=330526 RepID=A0AAE0KEG5_9PEZI|nr:hypothetical protein B0H63DRAFT_480751 [Podospora didyma]